MTGRACTRTVGSRANPGANRDSLSTKTAQTDLEHNAVVARNSGTGTHPDIQISGIESTFSSIKQIDTVNVQKSVQQNSQQAELEITETAPEGLFKAPENAKKHIGN